jgi:hypothetical protein
MNMSEKNSSWYQVWVHKFGIWSGLAISAVMMALPVAASVVYGVWPDWPKIMPAIISSIVWLAPYWVSQTLGFMQTMGPGALYSTYVTGNATNLKLPAIMATQNMCDVEPCSEAAHCVGVLAAGASAICVMLVLAVGVCFSGFIKPLVSNPTFKPAFQYAVPALFGSLVATNICSWKKIGYWVTPFIVTYFFAYHTKVASSWYMLITIASSIAVGRIVYLVQKKKQPAEGK